MAIEGVPTLSPVSFSVPEGQCLVITGSNGSGKTTLLRVLAGLQRPTGGAATVQGRRCDERDHIFRRELAAQIGPPPVARDLTLDEHLRLVAQTWRSRGTNSPERATGIVQELGLGHLMSRFPHQLSSGQAQLFALALTLVRPSSVLVLDEPEHRLDVDRIGMVIETLRSRTCAGTTVVLATHDSRFSSELGDQTLHLTSVA
ncbi:ATP-binding cassette domain-containing protein [Ornithinimicrobium sp. LYQ92]|uniref:ABC transporter ATP-binding protein n=1 Tax=Serinicoccus sp. LYQ92 TaxID=3378798 RepID=UPI0038534CAE